MKHMIILVLTFCSFTTLAQDKHLTTFGLKSGLNRSIINGHELDGTKTGYVGVESYWAFFFDTELKENWKFENEILFSYTDDYYFVELPLHVKYAFIKKTYALLGPKIDMAASNDDNLYDFNALSVSMELGIQREITSRIFTEFRYSHGLLKQLDDYGLDIYDGKRNTLRLGLGFRF